MPSFLLPSPASRRAHVGISWTRPASAPSGDGDASACPRPSRRAHVGISWTRPAMPAPVQAGTCRDQLDTPRHARARPGGHMSGSAGRAPRPPLPVTGTRPHARARPGGHMSGSAGRAPRLSLPDGGALVGINWTRPASVPSSAGARPGRPLRPAWHGTGGKVLPGRGTR